MEDPLLRFTFVDCSTQPPIDMPLSRAFHFRDELEIMRDMLQCPRYHGDTSNVLTGFHGFNVDPTLKHAFHSTLEYPERVRVLREYLPALDHHGQQCPEHVSALIERYRAWRARDLPLLFYCARGLYDTLFARRDRRRVIEFPFTACLDATVDRTFLMYLWMAAVTVEKTLKQPIVTCISTKCKHLALDRVFHCKKLGWIQLVVQTLKTYRDAHDITCHHRAFSGAIQASEIIKELFPHLINKKETKRVIKIAFKRFVAQQNWVKVTPKVTQARVDEMLVRTNENGIK